MRDYMVRGGFFVVALLAVFQDSPAGIMAYASRNLTSIGDVLKEGTTALESGLQFARLMKRKFGFAHGCRNGKGGCSFGPERMRPKLEPVESL